MLPSYMANMLAYMVVSTRTATRGNTMKHTARQTSTITLADLYRALDRRQPVTITYTKANGDETVRTIEPYDVVTTKAGDIVVKAMDRASQDRRSFRLDRIVSYTVHRTAFLLEHPAADTEPLPVTVTVNTVDAVIAREMAREDRAYYADAYDLPAVDTAA